MRTIFNSHCYRMALSNGNHPLNERQAEATKKRSLFKIICSRHVRYIILFCVDCIVKPRRRKKSMKCIPVRSMVTMSIAKWLNRYPWMYAICRSYELKTELLMRFKHAIRIFPFGITKNWFYFFFLLFPFNQFLRIFAQ